MIALITQETCGFIGFDDVDSQVTQGGDILRAIADAQAGVIFSIHSAIPCQNATANGSHHFKEFSAIYAERLFAHF